MFKNQWKSAVESKEEVIESHLLNVGETAGFLRLKQSTIRAWMLQPRIPFVRLGRRVFIRRRDCERMIVGNLVAPVLPINSQQEAH
jgi:excisionase family DNA binding protein